MPDIATCVTAPLVGYHCLPTTAWGRRELPRVVDGISEGNFGLVLQLFEMIGESPGSPLGRATRIDRIETAIKDLAGAVEDGQRILTTARETARAEEEVRSKERGITPTTGLTEDANVSLPRGPLLGADLGEPREPPDHVSGLMPPGAPSGWTRNTWGFVPARGTRVEPSAAVAGPRRSLSPANLGQ